MKCLNMSNQNKNWYWKAINNILSILMILLLFTTIFVIGSALLLPTANEYDDPNTEEINESFPWNPNIFTDFDGVKELFIAGFLRHISTLPEHLNLYHIINFSSYVFFLIFIHGVKQEIKNNQKFEIHQYAEWGIAAIVGSIMSVVRTLGGRDISDVATATILLSISALLLYLIHPKNWIKSFIEKYFERNKPNLNTKQPQNND